MLYSKYGFFSFFNLGLKIKNIDNICYVLMTNWKQFENAMNIPTRLVIRYLIAVKKPQCLRTWLDKCIDVLFYNKINTKNSIILGFFLWQICESHFVHGTRNRTRFPDQFCEDHFKLICHHSGYFYEMKFR